MFALWFIGMAQAFTLGGAIAGLPYETPIDVDLTIRAAVVARGLAWGRLAT